MIIAGKVLLKKFLTELILNPDKTLKSTLKIVLVVLMILIFVFSIPIIIISSIPTILFQSSNDSDVIIQQSETIAIYSSVIIDIDKYNEELIEDIKSDYDYCDSYSVKYNNSLKWQNLMAIDSILLNQDFTNANKDKLYQLSKLFFNNSVTTEDYTVEEEYEREIGHDETCPIDCKEIHTETYTETVTKTRCYIDFGTKSWEEMLVISGITSQNDIDIASNIYQTLLNIDGEGNLNIYDNININDLKEYPEGNTNLPYYHQADKRWGANSYGMSTIMSGGCGPTALAMVVSGLRGQATTPDIVANWSFRNGHRAEGAGSYWSLMTAGAVNYGLKVEAISRNNPNRIKQILSEGKPIIASMGKGHFTNGGHFIVLRGLTSGGGILVHDSASVSRSNTEWEIGIIINESSKNGGIYGSPFWAFSN